MNEEAFRSAISASGLSPQDRFEERLVYADLLEDQGRSLEALNQRLFARCRALWPHRSVQSGQVVDAHRQILFVSGSIVGESGHSSLKLHQREGPVGSEPPLRRGLLA